jgi:hypothetical protein
MAGDPKGDAEDIVNLPKPPKRNEREGGSNGSSAEQPTPSHGSLAHGNDDEEDDGDGQDDEPKLKYSRLTSNLGVLYRNGDATSSFLVAGDKMVRKPSHSD